MARYDAGWERGPRGRYDRMLVTPSIGWLEGAGMAGPRGPWHDDREGDSRAGLYGPGRYGLGPYHQRLRQRRRSDEELREEVEEALFYDTWVDAEAITVDVDRGVVVLRGELPSYEEVRYATDDAWDVDGVLGVRSELSVREP